MISNDVAFLHAVTIATTTSGAVMWMAGRIENGTDIPEILSIASATIDRQLHLLMDTIPPR
jgi:hypothetical protein